MDFDTQRKKRLEALEDRRKRLEEMREKRKKSDVLLSDSTNQLIGEEEKSNVDELVKSLLSTNITEQSESIPVNNVIESSNNNDKNDISTNVNVNKKIISLQIVNKVISYTIPSKNKPECYDKDIQTDSIEDSLHIEDNDVDRETSFSSPTLIKTRSLSYRRQKSNRNISNNLNNNNSFSSPSKNQMTKLSDNDILSPSIRSPANVDVNQIIQSSLFNDFLNKSSLVIERAMSAAQQYDILIDYRDDSKSQRKQFDSSIVSIQLYDFSSTKQRPVMDIHQSSRHNELIVVSYGSKSNSYPTAKGGSNDDIDAPGLVCVWSKLMPTRPEFIFFAPSPVVTVRFVDDDSHQIVGGCYNGQILLWDMRAKSLPVHRSRLAGSGHRHPVCAMNLSSATNANTTDRSLGAVSSVSEIVTSSSDGTSCQWDISRLSEPIETSSLPSISLSTDTSTSETNESSIQVTVSALVFGFEDNIKYAVYGTGSGHLLKLSYPYRNNDKITQIDAHEGLITSLDIHPSSRPLYHNLLLTSSLDWTVKLWHLQSSESPLLVFQAPSYDYVSDVKWCPVNPALFAAITSSGDIVLYLLTKSTTEYVERISVNKAYSDSSTIASAVSNTNLQSLASTSTTAAALNRLIWSYDGKILFIGDAKGVVHSFEIQDQLLRTNPGDDAKFESVIIQKKGNKIDEKLIDLDVSTLSEL